MERSGKKEELDELQKQVIKCFKLIKLVVQQYCGAFFKTGGSLSREAGKHQRAIQAGHEVSREQYRVSLEKILSRITMTSWHGVKSLFSLGCLRKHAG